MKTSSSQFDLMVAYMEKNGDLSKAPMNPRGRVAAINGWDELSTMLNVDRSGDTKTCEKWKKVWSDYKNNTKKKLARLQKVAQETGRGPAIFSKLSDLEHRVLKIMGLKVTTDLLKSAGLPQRIELQIENSNIEGELVEYSEDLDLQTQSPPRAITTSPFAFEEVHIISSQSWDETSQSIHPHTATSLTGSAGSPLHVIVDVKEESLSPTGCVSPDSRAQTQPAPSAPATPSHAGETKSRSVRHTSPRFKTRTKIRGSLRRPHQRPSYIKLAVEQFLQIQKDRRDFKIDQHRDYMEIKKEQNRIRVMELQVQRGWQAVGTRALDLVETLVNKYT